MLLPAFATKLLPFVNLRVISPFLSGLSPVALEFLSPTQENLEQMSAWLAGEINDKQLMESAYEIWERTRSLS